MEIRMISQTFQQFYYFFSFFGTNNLDMQKTRLFQRLSKKSIWVLIFCFCAIRKLNRDACISISNQIFLFAFIFWSFFLWFWMSLDYQLVPEFSSRCWSGKPVDLHKNACHLIVWLSKMIFQSKRVPKKQIILTKTPTSFEQFPFLLIIIEV